MTLEVAGGLPPRYGARQPADDLPDVNVRLALALEEHPHHAADRAYRDAAHATPLWFNRVTMLALVRLLCQRR